MRLWGSFLGDTLRTGAGAALATTLAIAACGVIELDNAAAPLNAISHIVWGDEAAAASDLSIKYTLIGLALNAAAMLLWAAIFEAVIALGPRVNRMAWALFAGAAVSALAYAVDYYVVPERLAPGFETRLSVWSLLAIYVVLAGSLALCAGVRSRN
jgi:hypothetical protein